MMYQDHLHHQIRDYEVWGGHVWGRPSQTGPERDTQVQGGSGYGKSEGRDSTAKRFLT